MIPSLIYNCMSFSHRNQNLGFIVRVVGHAAGGAVVELLRYKPDDSGIDSRWCH
jgi:hypothetical protein